MAGTDVSGINGIQENGTAVSGFPELPVLDSPESQYSGTGNNGINARIWWYYPAGTAGTAPPEQRYSKLRNGGLIWAGILSRDWRISLLIAAVWSFSAAGMNTALFIRMYMLQTLEILLLVLINIQIADKNFRMNFKERILISLNVIAGGLTHYYYYLFAGAMAISVFLYLLYHKRKQEALKYLNSYVIGGGINILVFPEAVNHIFREYRGVEVAHNLGGRADHPLKAYLGFINNSLFGGTLYLVLALFIISAVYCKLKISKDLKKQKLLNCTESGSDANCENSDRKAAIRTLDSGIKAIIISTIIAAAVFLYVAIVGSQLVVNRYIMPM